VSVYRLTNAATDDLIALYLEGLERFDLVQANRYHDDLERAFEFLARNPRAARLREEINPPVRAHPFKAHIIVYDCTDDGIDILRVRHGREDWMASTEDRSDQTGH
jgi:toxin ParE1/3/4